MRQLLSCLFVAVALCGMTGCYTCDVCDDCGDAPAVHHKYRKHHRGCSSCSSCAQSKMLKPSKSDVIYTDATPVELVSPGAAKTVSVEKQVR